MTSTPTADNAPIVVGVDNSEHAQLAVRWAVDTAARMGRTLRVVGVYEPQTAGYAASAWVYTGDLVEIIRKTAEDAVDSAVKLVHGCDPDVQVSGHVVAGSAAAVLTEESAHAAMVVVGSRGLGSLRGVLAGSVSITVAAHAACPVAVITHPAEQASAHVVVGIDGSSSSRAALAIAFEQAALRDARLTVVHTWTDFDTDALDTMDLTADMLRKTRRHAVEVVSEELTDHRLAYPAVTVDTIISPDGPAHQILTAASDTQLVVLGSRGRGGFTGLLLGSVSQSVLHHSSCPTLIVKSPTVDH